jgi:hypothetical protein
LGWCESGKIIEIMIKCTGNNDNGCFMDSCGHNCGCEGLKEFGEELMKVIKFKLNGTLNEEDGKYYSEDGKWANYVEMLNDEVILAEKE